MAPTLEPVDSLTAWGQGILTVWGQALNRDAHPQGVRHTPKP